MTFDHSWAESAAYCACMRFYGSYSKPVTVVDGMLVMNPDPDVRERFENSLLLQQMASVWIMRH